MGPFVLREVDVAALRELEVGRGLLHNGDLDGAESVFRGVIDDDALNVEVKLSGE